MNLKLKVETTVRLNVKEGTKLEDFRDIIRQQFKDGKFMFNSISFVADYRDEEERN